MKRCRKRWTDKQIEEMKSFLAKGMTAWRMADYYGVSYNAIIGVIDRHNLKIVAHAVKKETVTAVKKLYPLLKFTPSKGKISEWAFIENGQCRFPLDKKPCGKHAKDSSVYCQKHHKMSYVTS